MVEGGRPAAIRVLSSMSEVDVAAWDACAGPGNPFVSHAFLSILEDSCSATAQTGWLPRHLVLEAADGTVLGAVPQYLKTHSYGEYVFDWGWAEAYEQAGGRYYPKLQVAVPFTPVTGPRLLIRPGAPAEAVADALVGGLAEVAARHRVSSLHVTFPTEAEWHRFGAAGWLQRTGQQYHWENDGYASFEDFLGALAARKRKAIKKERREVAESGVQLHVLTGEALKPEHWDAFFRLYTETSDRKWGYPYLTHAFFRLLGERMAEKAVLVLGEHGGEWVAGALNFIGTDTLFGRNWGGSERFRFLHFEACYYQAIDFAIARGLKRVEAGAQGQHKIQRGYLPERTYSAHLIRDPALARAIADFLRREGAANEWQIAALRETSPFRKSPSADT